MDLFFRRYGQGSRNLVILHGLFGQGDNWVSIAKRFADEFTVWLPDLRNHGNSPHHPEMSYALMAGDVVAFCQKKGLNQIELIGHSMGGKVAMVLTLTHPQLVSRMVVVDIGPGRVHTATNHKALFMAMHTADTAKANSRADIEMPLFESLKDMKVVKLLMKNIVRGAGEGYHWRLNRDALERNIDTIVGPLPCQGVFTGKVLMVKGALSDYTDESDEDRMFEIFPLLRVVVINQAGHWVHADAPDEFYKQVKLFLVS
jgi:esterase